MNGIVEKEDYILMEEFFRTILEILSEPDFGSGDELIEEFCKCTKAKPGSGLVLTFMSFLSGFRLGKMQTEESEIS